MTVIRPNSIAGITSIAALGDNISFYNSDGVNISQFNVNINATSGVSTVTNLNVTGITTVGLGNTSTPPSNSQMSFELISNTQLRIKVRGTDGTLRSANITLA